MGQSVYERDTVYLKDGFNSWYNNVIFAITSQIALRARNIRVINYVITFRLGLVLGPSWSPRYHHPLVLVSNSPCTKGDL